MVLSLMRCTKDGVPYARPPSIEADIARALTQDAPTLRGRAALESTHPDHLRSECLVHVVRQAIRSRDDVMLNTMFHVLLDRCELMLYAAIPDRALTGAVTVREEVLGSFSELFASDGTGDHPDELDYFECRFNRAFRAFRVDFVRRAQTRLKDEGPLPLPKPDDDGEVVSLDDALTQISQAFQAPPDQESSVFMAELWDAIRRLPDEEREAVVLVHALGYDIESNDPKKETAATRARVSGRTIRTRLKAAAQKLSRFKRDT